MKVIEESPFPSTQMLDRVETSLSDRDALADYAEMLVKKVEDTRFPSTQLLKRIDETLARLEQQERLEAARGDDGTTESG
jgi:hypothetical protein